MPPSRHTSLLSVFLQPTPGTSPQSRSKSPTAPGNRARTSRRSSGPGRPRPWGGAVPEAAMERLEWDSRAGAVAAYREAASFDDAERAIPSAPGLTSTEKRAAWWDAWEALGRPSETRAEAALPEGRLQARVSAWQREQQWAPAHADASMRQSELDAETARTEAILLEA